MLRPWDERCLAKCARPGDRPAPPGVNEAARAAATPPDCAGSSPGAAVRTDSCACDRAARFHTALEKHRDITLHILPVCPRFAFPAAHPASRCRKIRSALSPSTTHAPHEVHTEFSLAQKW